MENEKEKAAPEEAARAWLKYQITKMSCTNILFWRCYAAFFFADLLKVLNNLRNSHCTMAFRNQPIEPFPNKTFLTQATFHNLVAKLFIPFRRKRIYPKCLKQLLMCLFRTFAHA